jgi:hypothetical protein
VAAGVDSWRVCRGLPWHAPAGDVDGVLAVYPPGTVELEHPRAFEDGWAALDDAGRLVAAFEAGSAATALPELAHADALDRRVLRYDVTGDRVPLLGPPPVGDGLVLACGYGQNGIALAPAVGDAVAEAIVAGGGWDDALLPGRFS